MFDSPCNAHMRAHTYGLVLLPPFREHPLLTTGLCLLTWKMGLNMGPKNPKDREKRKLTKQKRKDRSHGGRWGGRQPQLLEEKFAEQKICMGGHSKRLSRLQQMGDCPHLLGKILSPVQPNAGVASLWPWSPKTQPNQRTGKGRVFLAISQSSVFSEPQNGGGV